MRTHNRYSACRTTIDRTRTRSPDRSHYADGVRREESVPVLMALGDRHLTAQPGVQAEQGGRIQQVRGQGAAVEGDGSYVATRQAGKRVGIGGRKVQPDRSEEHT